MAGRAHCGQVVPNANSSIAAERGKSQGSPNANSSIAAERGEFLYAELFELSVQSAMTGGHMFGPLFDMRKLTHL